MASRGAAFIPGDGYIDPYSLTMAYARGARQHGATIEEGVCVEEIVSSMAGARSASSPMAATSAATSSSIAPGCGRSGWAGMAGVALAAGIVEHQYFLTEKKLSFDRRSHHAARP